MTVDSKELKFYMEVDVAKSASNDDWVFEGLASTSNLDLFGDVVYPESFSNSIEFFKSNGKIFYNHNYARKDVSIESQTPIGVPLEATIRDGGLYIKAALNKSHPLAQKIWHEFLTNPDPKFQGQIGLSIGAKALGQPRREYSPAHGKVVNFLPDLLLYEVSMTPTPVNPDTKTWVSVLKSVMDDVDDTTDDVILEVTPDEVVFDSNRDLLLVKSTVESEDGTKYTIEQYVNVKDEVRKAIMADDKNDKKPGEESTPPADAGADTAGLDPAGATPPAGDAPPVDAGADAGAAPGGDAGALPGADAGADAGADPFGGDAGGADPLNPGGDAGGEMPGADGGAAGGDMGGLLGGPGGDPGAAGGDPLNPGGDPGTDPGSDMDSASVAMLNDKVDTIQDAIISIANDVATLLSKDQGAGVEGTTTPPVDNTVVKSVVTEFYNTPEFKEILKSVVAEVLAPVLNQNPVIKSNVDINSSEPALVVPQVSLSTSNNQVVDNIIIKSAYNDEPIELDRTVLKGILERYLSINGSRISDSANRAEVIYDAEKSLGITSNQFRQLVQTYTEKGVVKI